MEDQDDRPSQAEHAQTSILGADLGAETLTERYELRWPGKIAAAQLAAKAPTSTLATVARQSSAPRGTSLPHTLPHTLADTLPHTLADAHLLIEGDNLEALKLLLPAYRGRIHLIYIDPPYNTGNSFIFADTYADSARAYRQRTEGRGHGGAATTGLSGRYHARWLSMLLPRLLLAHELLAPEGALCLSIGEEEVHHARLLLNEVFGEEHHRNTLVARRHDKNLSRQFIGQGLHSLAVGYEYVLIYARGAGFALRPVFREPSPRRRTQGYWKGFWNGADRPTMRYPLLGVTPERGQWKWQESIARQAVAAYQTYQREHAAETSIEEYWRHTGERLRFIRRNPSGRGHNQGVEHWIPPSDGILRTSDWTDVLASESLAPLGLPFDNPKSRELIELLLRLCGGPESLILDFFAGSGTTAHAALALNARDGGQRRVILVQRPEPTGDPRFPTISAIAWERLRRASEELADTRGCALLRVMGEDSAPQIS
jgi:adenine-specific DNA-methyltransferase